jgi:N utilization substance protein B
MASRSSNPREREPGPRHQAREAAVQVLYALDSIKSPDEGDTERALAAYWANLEGPAPGRPYCDEAVRGVMKIRAALDESIRAANSAWRVERMARVDRNVIRLAAWEMLHTKDVPPEVAIDEAVELARKFGTEDSPAFVNGTLDKVASMNKLVTRNR